MLILYTAYYIYWKPQVSGQTCNINQDCSINQYCSRGICREVTCDNDDSCNSTSMCINSYCESYQCLNSNDCPNGTACANNICTEIGTTCQSNIDCFGLSCVGGVCLQCTIGSSCPLGQTCFDTICRYPHIDEVSLNTFTFLSPSFERGNITAPLAYSCNKDGCNINGEIVGCTGGDLPDLCPSSCPFCVNSVCRCTSGEIFEECRVNVDCLSGLCSNNICIPIGGECASNVGGDYLPCSSNSPYCVDGKCSSSSLGAICGGIGMPTDLCYSKEGKDGMGFFCVNGRCSESPGELNQLCVSTSCATYNNTTLSCDEVVNRCL